MLSRPGVFPRFAGQAVLRRALIVALAGVAASAQADRSDRLQPLNFAADQARVEDNQRLNILTGRVEITKGTIVLRAERVEVRQKPDGTQTAVATGGAGGLAFFRQRRDGLNEFIEGEAERIEYDGAADEVRFIGRALMRRLEGSTVADQVQGQTIVYDSRKEVFQVKGGSRPDATPGRVKGVIAPRSETPPSP